MTCRSRDEPVPEVRSPACSMHEADDVYMGYAGKDELAAFLKKLLETEHTGTRVSLEIARSAGTGPIVELMAIIQQAKSRCCAMLLKRIGALGAGPSPHLDASYDGATAIAQLPDRIAFLNRAEGSVVRKLREMLPRVRDDQLHADLVEILRSHEANIALIADVARATGDCRATRDRGGKPARLPTGTKS